jgi:2-haloacid dehalogenase
MRAFVFDAYGTLFDVFSVTALCERLFPGKGSALAQLWRAKQLQYSLLRSLMGRYEDFWSLTEDGLAHAAQSVGVNLTPAARGELMGAYLRLEAFTDVRPALETLRQRGVRLAVLSNGAPAMLASAVSNAGLASLIDIVISADEVKMFKPHPSVYRLVEERLRLDAREVGFVSSNSWDICAASAGLKTFWIRRAPGEPPEELGVAAEHTVTAMTDLPAFVDRS